MEKDISFDGTLTMELTDVMLKQIKTMFEIEIMQGTCHKMTNGMNFVEINVAGDKGLYVLNWIKSMVTNPKINMKIMGLPIHKN